MPTMHIRGVPDELYTQVRTLAHARQRSLSAQVISLLERADQQQQQVQLLASIRRRRFHPPDDAPDSTDLLREDRTR